MPTLRQLIDLLLQGARLSIVCVFRRNVSGNAYERAEVLTMCGLTLDALPHRRIRNIGDLLGPYTAKMSE